MSKMWSHDPFGYLKHKLWPKEGPGVKLPIWFLATKSWKSPRFLCTYHWKALNEGYNFALDFTSIGGLHTKLWASKVMGVQILGILGLSLGSPETKCHLGVSSMARHKVYYKGEGGDFPQVWALVSFVNPCLHVARPCTKNVQIMH
jgi:hypothetical protein